MAQEMTIAEIMTRWPATIRVVNAHHMLCVGCAVSPFHSITEACRAQHIDEVEFRLALLGAIVTVLGD